MYDADNQQQKDGDGIGNDCYMIERVREQAVGEHDGSGDEELNDRLVVGVDLSQFFVEGHYGSVEKRRADAEQNAVGIRPAFAEVLIDAGDEDHAEKRKQDGNDSQGGNSFAEDKGGCDYDKDRREIIAERRGRNRGEAVGFEQQDPVDPDESAGEKEQQRVSPDRGIGKGMPAKFPKYDQIQRADQTAHHGDDAGGIGKPAHENPDGAEDHHGQDQLQSGHCIAIGFSHLFAPYLHFPTISFFTGRINHGDTIEG